MNDKPFDPYEVLGGSPEDSLEELEAKYRSAAQKAHPDKGGTVERMTDVNMAWSILSDPEMKKRYDQGLGSTSTAVLRRKAQQLLVQLLAIALRTTAAETHLIECLRQQVLKQIEGLQQSRHQTLKDLNNLRYRLKCLRGPEGNFIGQAIQGEIDNGERQMLRYEADEAGQLYALEMLNDYSWLEPMVLQYGSSAYSHASGVLSWTPPG